MIEKHNPWGDGVKGLAMFDAQGHYSWMIMSANRPKADPSPRIPVGQAISCWGPIQLTMRQGLSQTILSVVHFLSGMEEEVW